jgi:hypothetical protein
MGNLMICMIRTIQHQTAFAAGAVKDVFRGMENTNKGYSKDSLQ